MSHPDASSLIVERVSVQYPGHTGHDAALRDVSLQINSGELVVALGPSGCGKTTLLNLIAGFLRPSQGRVLFEGQPVDGPAASRGVVFQDNALLPWLNVIDNVALGLKLQGVPAAERQARALAVLKEVDLDGFASHRIWQLSGGMRQRVGLARALAANPQLLLMDEPFAALDAFTREQMQELVLKLWQQTGKRILLITHDIEEAVFLASELILMSPRPGRIVSRIALDFSRRYIAGESARAIKSDPAFIATREHVLAQVFAQRGREFA
ncbi:taurine ABC transporter ATP-binding subunit [Silvimonas amylolytica]|uniref:Taurine import ATP-binding protein TauB n=1 Tax=Silvimonas amylolytica TaxID=449663 RepID=A0ABQ2PLX9_9NEIS|nr:taurine ABC transporter ATP-binding subunit [Silvimonas amylolytica]GGP26615.1 taurine import ATP-binding protein TauB [Silvimonas amylolytica]